MGACSEGEVQNGRSWRARLHDARRRRHRHARQGVTHRLSCLESGVSGWVVTDRRLFGWLRATRRRTDHALATEINPTQRARLLSTQPRGTAVVRASCEGDVQNGRPWRARRRAVWCHNPNRPAAALKPLSAHQEVGAVPKPPPYGSRNALLPTPVSCCSQANASDSLFVRVARKKREESTSRAHLLL